MIPQVQARKGSSARRSHSISQALRFGAVGILNTCFSYIFFAVLLLLADDSLIALIGTTIISVAFNYQTSRRLVFRTGSAALLPRFLTVYTAILAINWTCLRGLEAAYIPAIYGQAIMIAPIAVLSFYGQRRIVFRPADIPDVRADDQLHTQTGARDMRL